MSFFCNCSPEARPGTINGNPMNGLCEKVCVQVKKVFDACMRQTAEENLLLTVTGYTPENPTFPLTFISARSTTSQGVISNLMVDPLLDRPGCSRVRADVSVPVEVLYTDANGVEGKGTATVVITQDVILHIPEPSIIPYQIEAVCSIVSPEGVLAADGGFLVTACVTLILKVVIEVELMIPSYGYAQIPPCQEFNQEVCTGFFELPLFPGGTVPRTR